MTLVIVYQAFIFAEDGHEAHFMRNLADVDKWNFGGASSTFATAVFAYSCHPSALDVFKVHILLKLHY